MRMFRDVLHKNRQLSCGYVTIECLDRQDGGVCGVRCIDWEFLFRPPSSEGRTS